MLLCLTVGISHATACICTTCKFKGNDHKVFCVSTLWLSYPIKRVIIGLEKLIGGVSN